MGETGLLLARQPERDRHGIIVDDWRLVLASRCFCSTLVTLLIGPRFVLVSTATLAWISGDSSVGRLAQWRLRCGTNLIVLAWVSPHMVARARVRKAMSMSSVLNWISKGWKPFFRVTPCAPFWIRLGNQCRSFHILRCRYKPTNAIEKYAAWSICCRVCGVVKCDDVFGRDRDGVVCGVVNVAAPRSLLCWSRT